MFCPGWMRLRKYRKYKVFLGHSLEKQKKSERRKDMIYRYSTKLDENRLPVMVRDGDPVIPGDSRRELSTPEAVYEVADQALDMCRLAEEYMYCFCLDNRNHLTGIFEISHGTVNGSLVSTREVMQKALLLGAVQIALVHNHPSGDPTPSVQDIDATKRVMGACKLMDINFVDHLVVGDRMYISMKSEGLLAE